MSPRRETHEAVHGKMGVETAIRAITGQQSFSGEVDRPAHKDSPVTLNLQAAEPSVHQQVPDDHEPAAIECAVQRSVGVQSNEQAGMIGPFEVMVGHQQDPTVRLNVNIAGFGARYTGWKPGITHTMGEIAWQTHDAATIVTEVLNGRT